MARSHQSATSSRRRHVRRGTVVGGRAVVSSIADMVAVAGYDNADPRIAAAPCLIVSAPKAILLSDDRGAWRPATQPPVPPAFPDPTQSGIDPIVRVMVNEQGFVYFAQAGNELAVWTSPDGDVWEPVDVSALALAQEPASDPFAAGGGYGSAAAGDVFTVSVMSTAGRDTRWIIAVS